jgi:hypothetical protein
MLILQASLKKSYVGKDDISNNTSRLDEHNSFADGSSRVLNFQVRFLCILFSLDESDIILT